MNIGYKIKKVALLMMMLILVALSSSLVIKAAATPDVYIKDGKVYFSTSDTTATTSITWRTVGFTVIRKPCLVSGANYGNPLVFPHAFFNLTDEMKD